MICATFLVRFTQRGCWLVHYGASEPNAVPVCVKEREKRHLGAFSLGGYAKDANYEVARPLVSLDTHQMSAVNTPMAIG